MFHHIEGAKAITVTKNGLYRQADIYRYKDRLYVKHGNGYAWVIKTSNRSERLDTSVPDLRVEELDLPFNTVFDKLGRLIHPDHAEKC